VRGNLGNRAFQEGLRLLSPYRILLRQTALGEVRSPLAADRPARRKHLRTHEYGVEH